MSRSAAVSKPAAGSGPPAEAGIPGWVVAPPARHASSGLDWHGNLELDNGYVKYSWDQASFHPVTVFDSRGRFVLGPMFTQDLGNDYYLRVTGQVVAWAREILNYYQINAEDVYVQVGQQGVWDFQAGRFLTWRVFRKGLGFDLYTLEDTGARTGTNFSDQSQWFQHPYEVNTIFLRDPSIGPVGRAAFHFYPTPWSGIEVVGTYGHLNSAQDVFGGRLAAGMKLEYFSLLAGAEYQAVSSDHQLYLSDGTTACDKCNTEKTYGAGGSVAVTPVRPVEIAFSFAYSKDHNWDFSNALDTPKRTYSWGGYLQLDAGSLFMPRSLFLGGAFFRTEFRSEGAVDNYQRHSQVAGYLAYPLGFNNAVVKLVFSYATGYQQSASLGDINGDMYSLRLRFAYYY